MANKLCIRNRNHLYSYHLSDDRFWFETRFVSIFGAKCSISFNQKYNICLLFRFSFAFLFKNKLFICFPFNPWLIQYSFVSQTLLPNKFGWNFYKILSSWHPEYHFDMSLTFLVIVVPVPKPYEVIHEKPYPVYVEKKVKFL